MLSEVWFFKSAFQQQKLQWVILCEDQEDDYHSLQPTGVQSVDYTTCGIALYVFGARNVNQMSDQEEAPAEQEEVAGHWATFLVALQELEAARKYKSFTEYNIKWHNDY
jgi:hypothetical protein